jgi:hypothetical protein
MKFHRGLRFKILASVFAVLAVYQGVSMLNAQVIERTESMRVMREECKGRMDAIYDAIKLAREEGTKPALNEDDLRCARYGKAIYNKVGTKQHGAAQSRPSKRDLIK